LLCIPALCIADLTWRGVTRAPGLQKNVWRAPFASGFRRHGLTSLLQRIRSRDQFSRPRWRSAHPGPNKPCRRRCAIFLTRVPECRSTVRPSRFPPPANLRRSISELDNSLTARASPQHSGSADIQPDDAAAVLAQINPENCDLHDLFPPNRLSGDTMSPTFRRGAPFHKPDIGAGALRTKGIGQARSAFNQSQRHMQTSTPRLDFGGPSPRSSARSASRS
jgi:hypothetical protein